MTRSGTRHWHDSVPESGTRKNCLLLKCVVKITMSNGETSFLCSLLTSSSYFLHAQTKRLGGCKLYHPLSTLWFQIASLIRVSTVFSKWYHWSTCECCEVSELVSYTICALRECKRIEIISFGGAATICTSEFPNFARCINYYAVNDPILNVVPSAGRWYAPQCVRRLLLSTW